MHHRVLRRRPDIAITRATVASAVRCRYQFQFHRIDIAVMHDGNVYNTRLLARS